ncbi:MAG: SDR family oxidoreductase [Candidatus Poseidoniales archaeon]|jgi:NAD(P)-dependent dehydrogenase (short-subunit alcohol dehydrogenase family)|tara:strand:- start:573 stop:1241 length:669 start_codon:yes stop_codon:yes gene_type:complete
MKTALVTGANRGIGLELTMQLLDSGYNVHATYRSNKGGLDEINNSALSIHQMDVRNKEDISVVIQSINSLDILINNAGIADGRWKSISEIDMEHTLEVLNINAVCPVLVTQQALPKLSNQSKVVMISSLMGSISDCQSGRSYAYRASKTALNMFSMAMKNELEEMGTSLLILHPGWVETDMGGPNAPLSKGESVRGIMQRIAEQNMSMSGRFVQFDGTPIEW